MRTWGPFLFSLLLGVFFAVVAILPPSPKSANAPDAEFSAARAMEDVRIIAAKPHPTGSAENAEVRAYLLRRLNELGVQAEETIGLLPERSLARLNRWSGAAASDQAFTNVVGVWQDPDSNRMDSNKSAVLLMAHHDTVWGSPGAADDTVGIASILEIIRALNSGPTPGRDIIILFTDAEELGLNGARQFFETNPLRDRVGAIINFEARGSGGIATMFQTSANNGNAARLYAKSVKQPGTTSIAVEVYKRLPNDTDLTTALSGDYVAYNISNIGRAGYYHSPKADTDSLQVSTLQHMGMQGLDLTRALLSADTFPAPKADATFFDVFGLFTVVFAPALGWVFILISGVCLAASYNPRANRTGVLTGAVRMTAFILLGGVVIFGLNWLSGAGGNYYDRLASIPKLEIMVLLAGLAVALAVLGRKACSENGLIGAALPLFALGIFLQVRIPTASYFAVLAILLFAFMILTQRRLKTRWGPALLAAIIIGHMLGLFDQLMLGVGPDMPSLAIVPLALLTLAALPAYAGLRPRTANMGAGVCLVLAVVLALWIRLDPVAATVPLY